MSDRSSRGIAMTPSTPVQRPCDQSHVRRPRAVPAPFPRLAPGTVVDGRYRVEHRIGAGGMGEVWKGAHAGLRIGVAMKTLRAELASDDEARVRFAREAHLLARIRSDHVARVLDFVDDARLGPVLVTEFVDGPPLSKVLESRSFAVEEAVELAIALVTGVRELHRANIVHRDVKPANVFVRPLAEGQLRAVFVDFGVSRLLPDARRRGAARGDHRVRARRRHHRVHGAGADPRLP
jgi:eukaryotic-like serine/threonine-protein kinase